MALGRRGFLRPAFSPAAPYPIGTRCEIFSQVRTSREIADHQFWQVNDCRRNSLERQTSTAVQLAEVSQFHKAIGNGLEKNTIRNIEQRQLFAVTKLRRKLFKALAFTQTKVLKKTEVANRRRKVLQHHAFQKVQLHQGMAPSNRFWELSQGLELTQGKLCELLEPSNLGRQALECLALIKDKLFDILEARDAFRKCFETFIVMSRATIENKFPQTEWWQWKAVRTRAEIPEKISCPPRMYSPFQITNRVREFADVRRVGQMELRHTRD